MPVSLQGFLSERFLVASMRPRSGSISNLITHEFPPMVALLVEFIDEVGGHAVHELLHSKSLPLLGFPRRQRRHVGNQVSRTAQTAFLSTALVRAVSNYTIWLEGSKSSETVTASSAQSGHSCCSTNRAKQLAPIGSRSSLKSYLPLWTGVLPCSGVTWPSSIKAPGAFSR